MYKNIIKPILFLLNPEKAHLVTVSLLKAVCLIPGIGWLIKKMYVIDHEKLKINLWDLTFQNPVGLAAGFDKDGKYIEEMSCLGFGFIELGTVTPKAQSGNEKPRLFRLPKYRALINRMGFNNDGLHALVKRLKNRRSSNIIIGGNIGKNKNTPNEDAVDDYVRCFEALFPYVDYFVVNVSSPNTQGLRALQEKEPLTALLTTLMKHNRATSAMKPILVKIAPDLSLAQLDDIVDIVKETGIQGVIATNTTLDRSLINEDTDVYGAGGLSGAPLTDKSTEVIKYLHQKSNGAFKIIGVGGIASAQDALDKLDAGASLVQIYTGLVYEGPHLIKQINRAFLTRQK